MSPSPRNMETSSGSGNWRQVRGPKWAIQRNHDDLGCKPDLWNRIYCLSSWGLCKNGPAYRHHLSMSHGPFGGVCGAIHVMAWKIIFTIFHPGPPSPCTFILQWLLLTKNSHWRSWCLDGYVPFLLYKWRHHILYLSTAVPKGITGGYPDRMACLAWCQKGIV